MKKTNLITTLALVVIVAIALSTATYAWYTSQSKVGTSDTTLYAATSTSASLAIDKTNDTLSTSTSIDLTMANTTTGISPMIPNAAPAETTTVAGFTFSTAVKNANGTFKTARQDATPAQSQEFYVINTNANKETKVNANVKFGDTTGYTKLTSKPFDWDTKYKEYYTSADNGETYTAIAVDVAPEWTETNTYYVRNDRLVAQLRVALFVCDANAAEATPKYFNTWASEASALTYVAPAVVDGADTWTANSVIAEVITDKTSLKPVAAAQELGTIAALGATKVQVVAWFDGMGLADALSGLGTIFTVEFEAVA